MSKGPHRADTAAPAAALRLLSRALIACVLAIPVGGAFAQAPEGAPPAPAPAAAPPTAAPTSAPPTAAPATTPTAAPAPTTAPTAAPAPAAGTELDQLRETFVRLKQELETLKRQLLSQGEEMGAAARRLAAEKETLAKDLTDAKKTLGRVEVERDTLTRELTELRAAHDIALAEGRAKATAATEAERARGELEVQLRAAEEKAAALQRSSDERIAAAEKVREDLEARIHAAEEKAAAVERSAEERLAAAEKAAADKLGDAAKDLEALRVRLVDLDKERQGEAHARAAAEQEVSALKAEVASLKDRIAAAEAEHKALQGQLATAKAMLPAEAGGTLSADDLRARAAEAAAAYVAAAREAKERPTEANRAAARDAAARLRAAQTDVARVLGAQGLYPMRRDDTLGVVASRFYGSGNRWPAIFEANKHVIANPDQVLPGMTLIVP